MVFTSVVGEIVLDIGWYELSDFHRESIAYILYVYTCIHINKGFHWRLLGKADQLRKRVGSRAIKD